MNKRLVNEDFIIHKLKQISSTPKCAIYSAIYSQKLNSNNIWVFNKNEGTAREVPVVL